MYEQLVIKLEERSRLGGVMATMHWDQEVVMPKAAAENRSKQMAALAGVLHEKSVDVEVGRLMMNFLMPIRITSRRSSNVIFMKRSVNMNWKQKFQKN